MAFPMPGTIDPVSPMAGLPLGGIHPHTRCYAAAKRHTHRALRRAVRRTLRSGVPQGVSVKIYTTPRAFDRLYGPEVLCLSFV